MNNYVSVKNTDLVFEYNEKYSRYVALIEIENICNKNVLTKLYLNSYQDYSASHSILLTKPKEKNSMKILMKKGLVPKKESGNKFVTVSVPYEKEEENLEEIKNDFKAINYKEIGQKIYYTFNVISNNDNNQIIDNIGLHEISCSASQKSLKSEINEVNRQIEEKKKLIEEKENEIRKMNQKIEEEYKVIGENENKNSNLNGSGNKNAKKNNGILPGMKFSIIFLLVAMFISMFFGALINKFTH